LILSVAWCGCALTLGADVYTARVGIAADGTAVPAGAELQLLAAIQERLLSDTGKPHLALNPATARLTSEAGEPLTAGFAPARLPGNSVGVRITFAAPVAVPAYTTVPVVLTFEAVGHEIVLNSPAMPLDVTPTLEQSADFALTTRGQAWDFSQGQAPALKDAWHATLSQGEDGTLVATADGQYSSPLVGSLAGPIPGHEFNRLILRARRAGPTEAALLVNDKTYPINASHRHHLAESFDLYTAEMRGRENWSEQIEKLWVRWGHLAQPTAADRIIIDWIRLVRCPGPYVFLGAIQRAPDDALTRPAVSGRQITNRANVPAAPTRAGFFRPAPDRGRDLPPDRIYPQGRQFGFSFYSVGGGVHPLAPDGTQLPAKQAEDQDIQRWAARLKADGGTLIGPQYELNHRALADAEAQGLHCIYTIGCDERAQSWTSFVDNRNTSVDLAHLRQRVIAQVKAVADHANIAWWDLTPEEMRWWRPEEMTYLQTVYEAIREADPRKRPVFMYEPNNRDAASLAKTLLYQDLSAKGVYANYAGQRATRGPWIRWSVEQEVEAIRLSGRTHAIPLVVPEMFQQPAPADVPLVGAWARHDTYVGLICGARGVIVFSLRQREGFTAHDAYYEGYASVARDLNLDRQLGKVLLFGEIRDDIDLAVTDGPATLVLYDTFGANLGQPLIYPSVAFCSVQYEQDRYLLAANSAAAAVTVRVAGLPPGAIRCADLFGAGVSEIGDGRLEAVLQPLEVKGWRLSQP
jgi:hypothetical protein